MIQEIEAERITLDKLPVFSDWPERILGEVDWTVPERDEQKIEQEYEQEKYSRLREFVEETGTTDPWEVKREQILDRTWQFADNERDEKRVCISQSEDLYIALVTDAQRANDDIVVDELGNVLTGNETVVELGCGYGYNLHLLASAYPDCKYVGGEYSSNAVQIAPHLYEDCDNVEIQQFNYYDDHWEIFDREFTDDVVVFTRLSIEQLPECESVIETLRESLPSTTKAVVHLEPVYELHDTDSMLGLIRKKYIEINDYNHDLLTAIQTHADIEVVSTKYDVFGFNGLNPMSPIRWEPV